MRDKKQQRKLMKLLKRAKRGASVSKVQQTLMKRARRKVSKDAKGDVNDSASSLSSDCHETASLPVRGAHGNNIVRLAQSAPGSLLESGVSEVVEFLQTKGGCRSRGSGHSGASDDDALS